MFKKRKGENAKGFQFPLRRTVYVYNINYSVSEEQLREFFEQIGVVIFAQLQTDEEGKSAGIAWIVFQDEVSAQQAISDFHRTQFCGRRLFIQLHEDVLGLDSGGNTSITPGSFRGAGPPLPPVAVGPTKRKWKGPNKRGGYQQNRRRDGPFISAAGLDFWQGLVNDFPQAFSHGDPYSVPLMLLSRKTVEILKDSVIGTPPQMLQASYNREVWNERAQFPNNSPPYAAPLMLDTQFPVTSRIPQLDQYLQNDIVSAALQPNLTGGRHILVASCRSVDIVQEDLCRRILRTLLTLDNLTIFLSRYLDCDSVVTNPSFLKRLYGQAWFARLHVGTATQLACLLATNQRMAIRNYSLSAHSSPNEEVLTSLIRSRVAHPNLYGPTAAELAGKARHDPQSRLYRIDS